MTEQVGVLRIGRRARRRARRARRARRQGRGRPAPRPGRRPTWSPSRTALARGRAAARGDPRLALARGLPRARRRATGPATSTPCWSTASSVPTFHPARPPTGARVIARTPFDDLPRDLRRRARGRGPRRRARCYDAIVRRRRRRTCPAARVDVTSDATIPADAAWRGRLRRPRGGRRRRARGRGAGLRATCMGDDVTVTDRVPDGTRVAAGDVVMRVAGPIRGLLTAERTALNFASPPLRRRHRHRALGRRARGHLGAGARHPQDAARPPRAAEVRRALRRRGQPPVLAVRHGDGQGQPRARGRRRACRRTTPSARRYPDLPVEVEVTDLDQLRELLDAGCDRILLDNMSDATMAEAVAITAGRATLEASGGLTLDRAREVAATGVDFISVGALTHSVNVFDLGMDLGTHDDSALRRHRQLPHRARAARATARCSTTGGWRPTSGVRRTSGRCWSAACCATATSPTTGQGIAVCSTVPGGAARVARHARAPLRHGAQRGGRAGRAHRRTRADGQPARGRRRPDRQRARRRPACTTGRRSSSTSAPPPPSTWSARAGSTSAARSPPASTSPSRRSAVAAPSCARSSCSGRAP